MTQSAHKPNHAISKAAQKGLEFHNHYKRGGTKVGLARAHQLIRQDELSEDVLQRMYQYFRRHEVDKKGDNFGNDDNPSAGYIAWLLWGGDDAYDWVITLLNK